MKNTTLLLLLVCSMSLAQVDSLNQDTFKDPVHLREVPRHNLIIDLGVAQPAGDFKDVSRSGLNLGAEYGYYFNKKVGLGVSLRHQYNEFGYLDFRNDENTAVSDNNYTNTSIAIGPTYSFTKKRFQFDVFAKAGVAFLNNPENSISQVGIGNSMPFSSDNENSSSSSMYIEGGLRFNYYFRRSVQVFFSPQFNTTLGNPLSYSYRDENATTVIQPALKNDINISNILFNVGVKIAIGKEYSNGEDRLDD
ncbi:outer membrane protein with beta-barrel domain [Nonlabens dokdonensis]|jgi:hypothetical protein|uniref:Uncharacterized protein n=2 Tax=Nonlabens dokdonensis TaxID=328515 RepID=L7WED3_NONDD|nr:outer membrane beta-barrel protein [Nonlabens dokdonensis]AGC78479.1 hypothetical protein DDD_3352 [Nonlabens dokdonensis DSW-6]PZX38223.1 outer membrane protein with beta-barrel domain [Nonlabens dokdonensis]